MTALFSLEQAGGEEAVLLLLARTAAAGLVTEAREALAEDQPTISRATGWPVPRFYQVEVFRDATPPGWWRPVANAPRSLRARIYREPDQWMAVELVGRGRTYFFRLSEIEASR